MKNALLLHGHGGSDTDYFWFGDTKTYLESLGYTVWWPLLPNTDMPRLAETQKFIEQNMPPLTEETVIIAHSSACPLTLHMMEKFKVPVDKVILVSGYYDPQSGDANMLPEHFNFDAIKSKAQEIVMINSDDDPWGCTDRQARPIAEKLAATFITVKGQGHMGSMKFNQPYREHDLVNSLI